MRRAKKIILYKYQVYKYLILQFSRYLNLRKTSGFLFLTFRVFKEDHSKLKFFGEKYAILFFYWFTILGFLLFLLYSFCYFSKRAFYTLYFFALFWRKFVNTLNGMNVLTLSIKEVC